MKIELSVPTIIAIKERIQAEKDLNDNKISLSQYMEITNLIDLQISSRVKANYIAEIA